MILAVGQPISEGHGAWRNAASYCFRFVHGSMEIAYGVVSGDRGHAWFIFMPMYFRQGLRG